MPKLDCLDCKIIFELQKDARTPFSDIAKRLGVKPGIVQARYNKMVKNKIIKGSTLILDYSKTEFPYSAGLEVRVVESSIEDVVRYVKGLKVKDGRAVCYPTVGEYKMLVIMDCRSLIEVHRFKQLIKQHRAVLDVSISIKKAFYYNYESLNSQLIKGA